MKKLTAIILAAIFALCLVGGALADKPYEGVTLSGVIETVLIGGKIVYTDGKFI